MLLTNVAVAAEPEPTPEQAEFFEKQIRPILAEHCHKCHGPNEQKGGLRLDVRAGALAGGETGPAVVPGKPEESVLIEAIQYDPAFYQMPPAGKLSDEQIAALTAWVRMGAPWPPDSETQLAAKAGEPWNLEERARHWSFQPIREQTLPAVRQESWVGSPVDRFILARLEAAGLSPARPADRRTLLRRVTYDLVGLPPSPGEIAAFLNDGSPDAFSKVVDRLLASPHYGERGGRHWLDLVRFAESSGHEFDYDIPHAWRYRDYIVRALNADVPYDRLIVEHVAGDLLEVPRREPITGTNESVVGTAMWWFGQGKHSPVDIRADECDTVDNQLDVFGKAFLGLTIACARCHDHKFDPIRTRDYYALAGFLQSSRQQFADINPPEATEGVLNQLAALDGELSRLLMENAAERIRAGLASWSAAAGTGATDASRAKPDESLARYLRETAAKDAANPLYPWAFLTEAKTPQEFASRRAELARRLSERSEAAAALSERSIVFEEFDRPGFEGWFPAGVAFGAGPTRGGEIVCSPSAGLPLEQIASRGTAHSGRVSSRLHGVLRSRTFQIDKKYIYYRMARVGGEPDPGRPLKNGQVHVIVDGFQFIKSPLHGSLSLNVPQGRELAWHRQDVSRFVGRTAYIELVDENDGSLVIDRILFSDDPAPPEAPNPLITQLLEDESLTSTEQLVGRYRDLLADTLAQWRSGRLSEASASAGPVELLNWILGSGLLAGFDGSQADPLLVQRLAEAGRIEARIPAPQYTIALTDGSAENEYVLVRGNHRKPGEEVPRRFLEVFAGSEPIETRGSGRLELARQLVDGGNPLVARVIVNRLWQHHFGTGFVASSDNFGVLGQPPSHPELLDFLANELVRQGWSLKAMHRLMLLSNAYQMSSDPDDALAEERNPENVLLHRMHVRRLEGEAIRDGILAVSGRLDRAMVGPRVLPHLTPFMEGRGRPPESGPVDGSGRRSLYINVRRNFLTPMFLAFDYPTPHSTIGRRSVSNVPAQALTLMNNPFVVEQARVWAGRVRSEAETTEERVAHLYETAYGRRPSREESQAAEAFLAGQAQEYGDPDDPRAWADLCHVLLNVKEFIFVR